MITFAAHQVRAGQAGASEDFEQMLGLLVRATSGEANLVFANPGDWGIDVLAGDLRGQTTVWQAKYFVRGVGRSQRSQIAASFASAVKAAADHGYTVARWVLCIPASMDAPTTQWWHGWMAQQERDTGVAIDLWDETRLRELLLRPEAADVRRHYYNPYRHDGQASIPKTAAFPYRGLNAFGEQDAGLFFGRAAATTRVLELMSASLAGTGLVVVSGVSGAGKSSLLRAGVLSRLRKSGLAAAPEGASWPCRVFTPGRSPLAELAVQIAPLAGTDAAGLRERLAADPAGFALIARQAALAGPAGPARPGNGPLPGAGQQRVLLLVDQLEQLFTMCRSPDERQAFITALTAAVSGETPAALAVLVVRADFEARCADYPELASAVQDRYLLTSMTERQVRMAITEPARIAGSGVADALADVLVREVCTPSSPGGPRPGTTVSGGALPLLSHALDQAWRHRTGDMLQLADYERVGGIEGGVATSADRAYQRLTAAQQSAARQIFMRLTTTSSDGVVTANRATQDELTAHLSPAEARDVDAVLAAFAEERLLVLGNDSVEISHEVMLTAWARLREWLDGDLVDRVRYSRLTADARAWDASGRAAAYLYPPGRLAEVDATADRWAGRYPPLAPVTEAFLRAARLAARRARQRLRAVVAVLSVLTIALATTAGTAVRYAANADRQRADASQQHAIALSRELAAESLSLGASASPAASDPVTARRLAAAAWHVYPTSQAASAMATRLAEQQQKGELPAAPTPTGQTSVAFSPDGRLLASAGPTVQLWDAASGKPLRLRPRAGRPQPGIRTVTSVAFSSGSRLLAAGQANGYVQLWDTLTGQPAGRPIPVDPGTDPTRVSVETVAFSSDSKLLASADSDGYIRMWDVATHRLTVRIHVTRPARPLNWGLSSLALSPDGRALASSDASGLARMWSTATGKRIRPPLLVDTANGVTAVAFSPDGKLLATGTSNGDARLWDAAAGSPASRSLPTGPPTLLGVTVAFSPDGKLLASADDGLVQFWAMANGSPSGKPMHVGIAGSGVTSVAFSPDGKLLASADNDGYVRLWNVSTRRPLGGPLPTHSGNNGGVDGIAFSPDGKLLASADSNGHVRIWDPGTGSPVGRSLPGGTPDSVNGVAFSPDGKLLASADDNGYVRLWHTGSWKPDGAQLPADASGGVNSVAFNPDGKLLASADGDGTVRLWDASTRQAVGAPMRAGPGYSNVNAVAFSPNGRLLATGDDNSNVRLWDVATGKQTGPPLNDHDSGDVFQVAFSPDGKLLASADEDGYVRLWQLANGRSAGPPRTIDIGASVNGIAFSPNGKLLASADSNGNVRLWDTATGAPASQPLAADPGGSIAAVAFSPDGSLLVSGDSAGFLQPWKMWPIAAPYAALCAYVGPPTKAEWARYAPGEPLTDTCADAPPLAKPAG